MTKPPYILPPGYTPESVYFSYRKLPVKLRAKHPGVKTRSYIYKADNGEWRFHPNVGPYMEFKCYEDARRFCHWFITLHPSHRSNIRDAMQDYVLIQEGLI